MAGQKMIYGGNCFGAPNHSTDSLFLSRSSPSFMGSRSMFSFEDVNCGKRSERPVFGSLGNNNDNEEYDEYFHNPEKKRRLGIDQVQFLEKSFEIDNKLEPERKIKLAKDLGLQPRQVAIWFQNRRARWKSKQLEKDYDVLQSSYNSLKADYEGLIKEKEKLNDEVLYLNDKLLLQQKEKNIDSDQSNTQKTTKSPSQEPNDQSLSEGEDSENPDVGYNKLEDISSDKSNILDSESPRNTDGGHSSLIEAGDASYEEDNFSKTISAPSPYVFPKIEDNNYPNPTTYSGYYGFPTDDQALEFWSY